MLKSSETRSSKQFTDASELTGEKPTREFLEIKIPVPWGHISGKWYGPQNVRPILGLHGWLDNAGTFDRLAPLISPHIAFLSIDLPGHGLSSRLPDGCCYNMIDNIVIIYASRDPKDVIVSFYYHFTGVTQYKGGIEEFAEQFLNDSMIYCSFWNHVLEFWLIREQSNILFLTYEDMKKDLRAVINKTSKFLKKDYYTQEEISQLVDHLTFDNMKENATCNNQGLVKALYFLNRLKYDEKSAFRFMRKGQVGGYKNVLPLKYIERVNERTKEVFEPYGLSLYCEF